MVTRIGCGPLTMNQVRQVTLMEEVATPPTAAVLRVDTPRETRKTCQAEMEAGRQKAC
jgi:hypothetical protein